MVLDKIGQNVKDRVFFFFFFLFVFYKIGQNRRRPGNYVTAINQNQDLEIITATIQLYLINQI